MPTKPEDLLVPLMLTPDEASRLYHTFVNGLQGPDDKTRQSLAVKIERARAQAQTVRALVATGQLHKAEKRNGKEASIA